MSEIKRKDLRVKLTIQNNLLYQAILEKHSSVLDFCRKRKKFAKRYACIYELLSFKVSPFTKNGDWREIVVDLSKVLGKDPTELFPAEVYEKMMELGSIKVVEVSSFDALPRIVQKEILALPAPVAQNPEFALIQQDKKAQIMKAVRRLRPVQRQVITLRYGLVDGKHRTYEEVGAIIGKTGSRVQQIIRRAEHRLKSILPKDLL